MDYAQDAGSHWIENDIIVRSALKKLENIAERIGCFIEIIIYVLNVGK